MTPKVSQHLNKTILVSIPALFEDGKCRAYKLLGAEVHGLWLESDELAGRLLADDNQHYASAGPVVFVPFAQIAGVLVATRAPTAQPPPKADDKPSAGRSASAKAETSASSAGSWLKRKNKDA